MEQKKILFPPITTKPWGKHIPKTCRSSNTPNQGEINSQILYSEPEGLNTKELPRLIKALLKKGLLLMPKTKLFMKIVIYLLSVEEWLERVQLLKQDIGVEI